MSSIVELLHGNGRLDTLLRAVSMALVLGVCVALIWTTLFLRRDPAPAPAALAPPALPSTSIAIDSTQLKENAR